MASTAAASPPQSLPPAFPDCLSADDDDFKLEVSSPSDATADAEPHTSPTLTVCSHVMYYARTDAKTTWLDPQQPVRAYVLMTFREDGCFGFPGGVVEPEESRVEGLNRECREEINSADGGKYAVSQSDFLCCHSKVHPLLRAGGQCQLHFYAKEISVEDFKALERAAVDAEYYGTEIYGVIRVPVHTHQGVRGLPYFLRNVFAGNARSQLLYGLYARGILTLDEVKAVVREVGKANFAM